MKQILIAVILFLILYVIKTDFIDGTISLAHFFTSEPKCEEEAEPYIMLTTVAGDSIESLFALYPDPQNSFVERLTTFYALNPHLQNQQLIEGITVKLPLAQIKNDRCS